MRKPRSPQIIPSSRKRQSSSASDYAVAIYNPSQHPQKSRSTLKQKLAGAFKFIFFWKKKPIQDTASSYYGSGDLTQAKGYAFSRDTSKASNRSPSPYGSGNHSQAKSYPYSRDASRASSSGTRAFSTSSSTNGQSGTLGFSVKEIYQATGNFSPANKIGEGSYGIVYRGKLRDGTLVAVKRAKQNMNEKDFFKEFKNEILTLSQIEHQNLVRFFGYLDHGDERMIVVEYVGNGNLREYLDGKGGNVLEAGERLDIAIDVAHALTYLHTYTEPAIIHRDIKSSNILITDKLRAKVSDFGFARLAADDPGATHISTQVKGTAGYMDPEYITSNKLTEKSDVYSFGVLLVEMVTGRRPIEQNKPPRERITIKWAMQKLKQGDSVLAMDPMVRRSPASVMAVEKILRLAHQCLAPTRQQRPSMQHCAEVLWKIRKDFKDLASPSPSTTANTTHNSESILTEKTGQHSFGVEGDPDYKFASA